jgi:hypothetical protein
MNARIQTVNGNDYLTFWHGAQSHVREQGHCVFYDSNYNLAYNVTIQSPLNVDADMHECEVTSTGSVLLTAYVDIQYDMSSLGGFQEDILADSCFQEVDIESKTAIFTWCASDYFSPNLTYPEYPKGQVQSPVNGTSGALLGARGFDAYHINSLQKVRLLGCFRDKESTMLN